MASPSDDLSPQDLHELTALAVRYASAADDREFAQMANLFARDGQLIAQAGSARVGRDAIATAVTGLERYDATFHLLGQISHWVDDDGETCGEVYCVAHHFIGTDEGTSDRVMYVRYKDRYIHEDGAWRFAERQLHTTWAGQEDKPS